MEKAEQTLTSHHLLILGLVWTLIILVFAIIAFQDEKDKTIRLATAQARASFGKDQALRLWATRHGRIYVPVSDYFQPDPCMAKVPERDISTPSGIELTLINPVTIINQLDRDYGYLYGTSGKITSLTAGSPANSPDAWEKSALKRINAGAAEVLEFVRDADGEKLRLMQPLTVTPGCLLCHYDEGFEVGKPGGGIAISLPMNELLTQEGEAIRNKFGVLAILWVFGMIGLGISTWLLRRQARIRFEVMEELRRSEQRKSAIVGSALDCIISIDGNDRIVEFNPAAERTFGYRCKDVLGQPMAELLVPESLREQHYEGLRRQMTSGEDRILGTRIETIAMRADGSEFPVELAITRIEQPGKPLFTAFLRDITERHLLERKLLKQASHDDLTGLYNRHTFESALKRTLLMEDAPGHCLMYMDLDRFKVVNDTSGHGAGDELLKQLAELLNGVAGERGLLGRLGGDEFGLIVQNCSLEGGQEMADGLLQAVHDFRFYWEDKIFTLGMSIGLVFIDNPNMETSQLLSMADAACYRAKEEGRNRYYVYSPADQVLNHRQAELNWINRIERAFAEERFELYYQPIARVVADPDRPDPGFIELLLRMRDEEQQLVTPDKFLPAAERYNLMPSIDRWVVRHALRWLGEQAAYQGRISINLSGSSLTDALFLDFLLGELENSQVEKGRVCFEITETEAISNLSRARKFIARASEAGCLFALDDFGSGMSSYGYLKDLPVDFLKIDGRFVRNMDIDPVSMAMVKSIHEIGHLMGKQTIAEFVGHAEVLRLLREMGVNYVQGFYIGEPSPLADLVIPQAEEA